MILLWGLPDEPPLAAIVEELRSLGSEFFILDQYRLREMEVSFKVHRDIQCRLKCDAATLDLAEVGAAYLRPYPCELIPTFFDLGAASSEWRHGREMAQVLWTWADTTPSWVVNRPMAMASNESKPYQSGQIAAKGFSIPPTLVTNDESAARAFWRKHGEVIYKSISSQRSRIRRLSPGHKERWKDLAWCPTQFQARIPGTDVRVHVIENEVVACEIESAADDYRYPDGHPGTLRLLELPSEIRDRCIALTRSLGLAFAGIDLRRTPQGQWFCFEANPAPDFTYFDRVTHGSVARLLAIALHRHDAEQRRAI